MADYASVVSLMNLVDQVLQHQALRHHILFHGEQIQEIRQTAESLKDFLEGYSHATASGNEAEIFDGQIASAALAVQDVIKSHMLDQVRAACTGQREVTSADLCDLKEMVAKMDSIKAKAMVVKIQEKTATKTHSSSSSSTSRVPSSPSGNTADIMGFDEQVIQIMDRLTGQSAARLVIPIVGMGGIGKTTLARAVYEGNHSKEHFDVRIWITMSQEFSIEDILLQAFMALHPEHKIDGSENEDWLRKRVHQTLCTTRKYLIIMDDIWSIKAWREVELLFPENNVHRLGRFLLTTRLSDVGDYFGSDAFKMQFLEEDKSWNLFCVKAFGSQSCPPEFEEIGKKIVGKCQGLPLSIVVIGGLLTESHRTQQYWESVEKDMNSILSSENHEYCLNILSLSYQYLPVYLKPCFLYWGIFKEDQTVRACRLIKLWVAEGFLKPYKDKSMEEIAMDYLRGLVDRNLILKNRDNTFSIHDLLREVSLRIGQKENFFRLISMHIIPYDFKLKIWEEAFSDAVKSTNCALPFLFHKYRDPTPVNRDLWMVRGQNIDYSTELFPYKLLSFPYLHFSDLECELPEIVLSLLYNFWNLQTLIFSLNSRSSLTIDIWKMPQIRHIIVKSFYLADARVSSADESVLENLQTLAVVQDFRCTEQVLRKIPNVKYLNLIYNSEHSLKDDCLKEDYCLNNVRRFHKLETFICRLPYGRVRNLDLPTSLKNLCLLCWELDLKDMKLIGELPYLEFLKLEWCEFTESELRVAEGGFQRLKCFQISYSDLSRWTVDSSHDFLVLERFRLEWTTKLFEIPYAIADISTLNLIYLIECPESLVESAVEILEQQYKQGNEDLQLNVSAMNENDVERYREVIASEDENVDEYRKNLEISEWNPFREDRWKWELEDEHKFEGVWSR